jgi:hypothetical protein
MWSGWTATVTVTETVFKSTGPDLPAASSTRDGKIPGRRDRLRRWAPCRASHRTVRASGYVYDAKQRMAALYVALGDEARAARLRADADALFERFNGAFWMEDEGTYAFGIDAHKQRISSIVSNAGHCLWSAIVPSSRAGSVVTRLLAEDMWSGWGIRTLSAAPPAFNPFAYQRGSVWPHDNALIASGCRRYGYTAAVGRSRTAFSTPPACSEGTGWRSSCLDISEKRLGSP